LLFDINHTCAIIFIWSITFKEKQMNTIMKVFKDKRLKLTPQRIAVYEYLLDTREHPSAEVIYTSLQEKFPTMSLATVYKSLKTLVEVNLISEINLGEGNFRYDSTIADHPHIQCIHCNKVEDIMDVPMTMINREIVKYTDYKVLTSKLYFYGICNKCKIQES